MADLRYPIGKFEWIPPETGEQMAKRRQHYIEVLAKLPSKDMATAVRGLNAEQLDTPYRPEGWTVRQVVHHVPDSHPERICTVQALRSPKRTIRPSRTYDEEQKAQPPRQRDFTPIEVSLQLLGGLQSRWVDLVRSMRPSDFARTLLHPERGTLSLDQMLAMYAWHSAHHTAHITSLRQRMGWN